MILTTSLPASTARYPTACISWEQINALHFRVSLDRGGLLPRSSAAPFDNCWGGELIKPFRGKMPQVHATAFVSQTALVMGDVHIGPYAGIWPGAVIRGDFAPIVIGAHTIIEDNCVVHSGEPLNLGEHVIVGHGAVVHGRDVGNRCMIANNSTILDGAVLGQFCIVGAGCVVSPNADIPDESLVYGVPHKVVGAIKSHQRARLERGNASYIERFAAYREAGI